MNRIIFVSFFVLLYGFSFAQNSGGIEFSHGNWEEIKAAAKKEKKLIFIDCYTSWCGPCKRLSKEIFTQAKVGDFFNQNFISYKVDMEKGIGVEMNKKYHVGAYPTLLWLDHKGNMVHRTVGFIKADALIDEAQSALSDGNFDKSLGKKYSKNKDNPEHVKAYMDYLIETADSRSKEVTKQYLSLLNNEDFFKPEVFNLIVTEVDDPFIQAVEYVASNYDLFAKKFKNGNVERLFKNVYFHYSRKLLSEVSPENDLDEEKVKKLENQMAQINFEGKELYIEKLKIKGLAYQKEWKTFTDRINKLLAEEIGKEVAERDLQDWYSYILKSDCADKQVLSSAVAWVDLAIEKRLSQYVEPLIKYWQAKISLLERIDGPQQEISKAKTELELLEKIDQKQKQYKEKLEKQKKLWEDVMNKSE